MVLFNHISVCLCCVFAATVPDSLKVCGSSHQPECGKLLLSDVATQRRAGFKFLMTGSVNAPSLSLLIIQAHEVLCLEMLTLLLERPTDDSVEVSIAFLKECGLKLTEVSPRGINGAS